MRRVLVAIGALVAAAVAFLLVFVLVRGESVLTSALESILGEVTDTPVALAGLDVDPSHRAAHLRSLTVANPPGFADRPAMRFGAIDADLGSVAGGGPIVIRELRLGDPLVAVVALKGAKLNVDELRRRIEASARRGARGVGHAELGDVVAHRAARARVRIETLRTASLRVEIDASQLGREEPIHLTLPGLQLHDVGGADGATPAELTRTIALAMLDAIAPPVADAIEPGIPGALHHALDALRAGGREALEKLRE